MYRNVKLSQERRENRVISLQDAICPVTVLCHDVGVCWLSLGHLDISQTKSTGDLFSHVKPKVLNNSNKNQSLFKINVGKKLLHNQVGSSTSMIYTRALSLLYIKSATFSVFNTQKNSDRNISKEATFRDTIEVNPVPSPFLWNYLKNGPLIVHWFVTDSNLMHRPLKMRHSFHLARIR